MSASPIARQAVESKSIPIKKVHINDPSELPAHYSATPGGTLYSTTPGGTRIVYEKSFLMHLRNSPISKTPPSSDIPNHLVAGSPNRRNSNSNKNTGGSYRHQNSSAAGRRKSAQDHDEQFQIEL